MQIYSSGIIFCITNLLKIEVSNSCLILVYIREKCFYTTVYTPMWEACACSEGGHAIFIDIMIETLFRNSIVSSNSLFHADLRALKCMSFRLSLKQPNIDVVKL